MTLRIQLLGGLSASIDGAPVALPTRKATALLALLACRPGTALPRERVCGLLWSRSPEAQARTSLRQALAQLRQALGATDAVEAGTAGIRLLPERAEVDLAILEAALADGTPDRVRHAAALFRGDFLDGFLVDDEAFEEWRRTEMRRVREQTLLGFGRLLGRLIESGEAEAGIELGERLLALEPTSEETHRALMRLYLSQGAVAAAVRQYERCRSALEAELGVPPSAETEALRREVARRPRPESDADGDGLASPSVAVLPFANLSDEAEQAYFAQGFAEDVLRELARFRPLRVISWHSSSVFAGSRLPSHEIGRQLGADYLLTGSVRRMARSVRIGAELVEAHSGRQAWTARHDVPLEDLFEVQDEVVAQVAAALEARIGQEALKRARAKPVDGLLAYDCWLRGMACLRTGSLKGLEEARTLFHRALDAAPTYARAYAGLSLAHFNDWSCLAWDRWDENERGAFENARKAVELDDGDHVAQFILARILLFRRDFDLAERHLERACALNGNDADTLCHMALAWASLGEPERGVAMTERARRLNPFHDDWYYVYAAACHFLARRLETAIPLALKAPDLATDIRALIAASYAHLGQTDAAREQGRMFLQVFRRNITHGRAPEADEPVRWVLHVNPLRRAEDRAFLLDGLARAGLAVTAAA